MLEPKIVLKGSATSSITEAQKAAIFMRPGQLNKTPSALNKIAGICIKLARGTSAKLARALSGETVPKKKATIGKVAKKAAHELRQSATNQAPKREKVAIFSRMLVLA